MPALSVTYSAAAAAVCVLWRYISVVPLPLPSMGCDVAVNHNGVLVSTTVGI